MFKCVLWDRMKYFRSNKVNLYFVTLTRCGSLSMLSEFLSLLTDTYQYVGFFAIFTNEKQGTVHMLINVDVDEFWIKKVWYNIVGAYQIDFRLVTSDKWLYSYLVKHFRDDLLLGVVFNAEWLKSVKGGEKD